MSEAIEKKAPMRQFDDEVVRAVTELVETYGQPARDYLTEVIAVAHGRGTPGRLDELADRLARLRGSAHGPRDQQPNDHGALTR